MKTKRRNGYTLVELMVSIGIFAIIMVLVAGVYVMIINASREAQGVSTAVDSVSFSLQYMTQEIRTGTAYGCPTAGIDCPYPAGGSTFSVTDQNGANATFSLVGSTIYQGGAPITDPSIHVSSLRFYSTGTQTARQGDYIPPHVTIVVSGIVTTGKGAPVPFTIETGSTMRGIDL
jgi:prepilin-type N-terminal cleavage/methylation domain-containing protein